MKKWSLRAARADAGDVSVLASQKGLYKTVAEVLAVRGIDTPEKADEFFDTADISDPMLMEDMSAACDIIQKALRDGTKIAVYGDYDCDGVTSTVMLYSYLTALGGETMWYIPTRAEGYGMNKEALKALMDKGAELFITVDNGISAEKEAEYIYENGAKLIITDHHQPPEILPRAEAILNPKRADDYSPFKTLAGCGVVLKLIMALEGDSEVVMDQYGDLAAIGTVGDVVPLVGENRHIVEKGLEAMAYTENVGLVRLLSSAGISLDDEITSTTLAFSICPRINAAGRFSDAKLAAELLISESEELAGARAAELTELNQLRQKTEKEITAEIEARIAQTPELLSKRCLTVSGVGWHHGVIGIVAAKLLQKYGKPVIIISAEDGEARGSARSIEGFSLYRLLESCSSLLTRYGGHTKAAGFSLRTSDIEDFIQMVDRVSAEKYPTMPTDTIYVDKELTADDFELPAIEQLSVLQPFGEENPVPVFLMRSCTILSKKPLKDGKYVSFSVRFLGREKRCLCFGMTSEAFWYDKGDVVDLLVNLEINEYNDARSVAIKVKDIRLSAINQDKYFAALGMYNRLMLGESADERLSRRIFPEKRDIRLVYDLLRKYASLDAVRQCAFAAGVNCCMTMVIVNMLCEFNLLTADIAGDRAYIVPAAGKADFSKSEYIEKLKKQLIKE